MTKPIPKEIKATGEQIHIVWSDGRPNTYLARDLRMSCRCAACVDEWSHDSLIKPEEIPQTLKPLKIEVVGSYALQFTWSDGHSTGIYSYDYLRELGGDGKAN